jgi:hypothetical protein
MLVAFSSSRYSGRMGRSGVALLVSIVLGATASHTFSEEPNWAGEYADKNFLNGQAVFQMSLEQSGKNVSVWFSAGYNDGHACGPDATGTGKVTAKGVVEFTFQDSASNSGTGTIMRASDGITVSMKTTRVVDSRCVVFYRQNIRLKRVR